MRLLTIDTNPSVLKLIELSAVQNDWELEVASRGAQAMSICQYFKPHLVLLDAQCLSQDGPSLLRKLRFGLDVPILLMVTRGEIERFSEELFLQCDDFICKPFHLFELKLRIRSTLSGRKEPTPTIEFGLISINRRSRQVHVANQLLGLTPKEYELLLLLVERQGAIISNQEIIAKVWPDSSRASASDVQQYIHHLRQKMRTVSSDAECIHNEKGFGYRLDCQDCSKSCMWHAQLTKGIV